MLSVHELLDNNLGNYLVRFFVAPFSFPVQAASYAVKAWLVGAGVGAERIFVAYPVIEGQPVSPRPLCAESLNIAVVGRVNGTKGHSEVARAFRTYLAHKQQWRLSLYGSPYVSQRKELDELLEEIKDDSRIRYRGERPFGEIAQEVDAVASFPQKPESFGLVPLEGWFHGLRSVGWRWGGAAEVLRIVGGLDCERPQDAEARLVSISCALEELSCGRGVPATEQHVLPHFSRERRKQNTREMLEAAGLPRIE
ncbi:glycosyltransferase [Sinomonas sp. R1AF57]|uniref:glycosyltransferase n=1 Tax=Sinomonas sp. R1AF57 TaxID=2020377 RepID=UPI001ABF716F|nr:glycosyltransferase [Sinomonas sp. R1AF57]